MEIRVKRDLSHLEDSDRMKFDATLRSMASGAMRLVTGRHTVDGAMVASTVEVPVNGCLDVNKETGKGLLARYGELIEAGPAHDLDVDLVLTEEAGGIRAVPRVAFRKKEDPLDEVRAAVDSPPVKAEILKLLDKHDPGHDMSDEDLKSDLVDALKGLV